MGEMFWRQAAIVSELAAASKPPKRDAKALWLPGTSLFAVVTFVC
jgi:hypothetical protein